MDSIASNKKALRRELLSTHRSIPKQDRLVSDRAILQRVSSLPAYLHASYLFIFIGEGWEVETMPLIQKALALGKTVSVPRCLSGGVMEACIVQEPIHLHRTQPLGLLEPPADTPVLAPSRIEFALIPCIACDLSGYRLGRGGGYYDRFLADGDFITAAVCRQSLLQDKLPIEPHDQAVDLVITESSIYSH